MKVGLNILIARTVMGLTQRELASLIGSTQAAISDYENNKRCPHTNRLVKIAKVLSVRPGFFFEPIALKGIT